MKVIVTAPEKVVNELTGTEAIIAVLDGAIKLEIAVGLRAGTLRPTNHCTRPICFLEGQAHRRGLQIM